MWEGQRTGMFIRAFLIFLHVSPRINCVTDYKVSEKITSCFSSLSNQGKEKNGYVSCVQRENHSRGENEIE